MLSKQSLTPDGKRGRDGGGYRRNHGRGRPPPVKVAPKEQKRAGQPKSRNQMAHFVSSNDKDTVTYGSTPWGDVWNSDPPVGNDSNMDAHTSLWDTFVPNYPDVQDQWEQPAVDVAAWGSSEVVRPPRSLAELNAATQNWDGRAQVKDVVPFWLEGIDAARDGRTHCMEAFLEKLATRDACWRLGAPNPEDDLKKVNAASVDVDDDRGWGCKWPEDNVDRDVDSESTFSDTASRVVKIQDVECLPTGKRVLDIFDDSFVEDIALQEAVSPERRQRMHLIYRMSTEDKLKGIYEMIRHLRMKT